MIAKNWKQVSLSEVCEINPGKQDLQDKSKELEVSFLPMAAVSEEGKILTQGKRKLKDVIKGYTNFRDGDVLLAKITPCFENGKRAIAKDLMNGIGFGSTEFHVLRPKDEVTSDWIFYAISRSDFCNIAKSQMTGTAGQKRVPTRVLEQFEIPIPSVKEQETITGNIETQLTRLDAAIKSLKAVRNKLVVYRQSILHNAFNRDWPVTTIKEVCVLVNGRAFKPTEWTKSGLPIIRIQNLNNDTALFNYCDFEVDEKYYINKGDLLFAWSGTPDTSFGAHIWEGTKAVLNQHIFKILIDERKINKKFFMRLLNKNVGQYIQKAHGTAGLAHITKGKFENSEVRIPSKEIQDKVVQDIESKLSVIAKTEESVDKMFTKTEKLRSSILKSAFEGKLVN